MHKPLVWTVIEESYQTFTLTRTTARGANNVRFEIRPTDKKDNKYYCYGWYMVPENDFVINELHLSHQICHPLSIERAKELCQDFANKVLESMEKDIRKFKESKENA